MPLDTNTDRTLYPKFSTKNALLARLWQIQDDWFHGRLSISDLEAEIESWRIDGMLFNQTQQVNESVRTAALEQPGGVLVGSSTSFDSIKSEL